MRLRGWWCVKLHGSRYQKGLPDWYCCHLTHGTRWIETKSDRKHHCLELSQVKVFKEMSLKGVGVWVLRGPEEYKKLFKPANWASYIRSARW